MDGSVLAVLAAYQNNLVSSENDDVTSGSLSWLSKSGKVDFCSERVKNKNTIMKHNRRKADCSQRWHLLLCVADLF